jgi:glycosyltransferase involved in cell wall biosynthesis
MKILMVSAPYPPMPGGVARYTLNLTMGLRNLGFEVNVACDDKGNGDFPLLSSADPQNNSKVLLNLIDETKPHIVHVQFEPGLYGAKFDPKHPKKLKTNIDDFYLKSKTPIVTTFHVGHPTLNQWMRSFSFSKKVLFKRSGRTGKAGIPVRALHRMWTYSLMYYAIKNTNTEKFRQSKANIVFSNYLSAKLGGGRGQVIYHGAEPAIHPPLGKQEARKKLSIPLDNSNNTQRIVLAIGYRLDSKGWDIIKKLNLPNGWKLLVNTSKGFSDAEDLVLNWEGSANIIDLKKGFLDEEELSMLFYASDAIILPYKPEAGPSGTLIDALAHGLPFIATDLGFFKEFSALGLGITVKRSPQEFSKGIKILENNYSKYVEAVDKFKDRIKWGIVSAEHASVYASIKDNKNT